MDGFVDGVNSNDGGLSFIVRAFIDINIHVYTFVIIDRIYDFIMERSLISNAG